MYFSPHVESEGCEPIHQDDSVNPPLGQVPWQQKALALIAIEEHHLSKSAGTELRKDVAAAARIHWKTRLFAILTKILRRIQIYCCFG